jgi:hypothetical protein
MALGPDRGAIETRPSDARSPPAAYATVRPALAGLYSIWKLGPFDRRRHSNEQAVFQQTCLVHIPL